MNLEQSEVIYRHNSKEEYYILHYRRELQFAIEQLTRQYDSAAMREREEWQVTIIYLGIVLATIILWPLLLIAAIAGVPVFSMLCAFVAIMDGMFQLFLLPFALYRVMNGIALYEVNCQGFLGRYLIKRWKVPIFKSEKKQCKELMDRYKAFIHDLDDYEEDVRLGHEPDFQMLHKRLEMLTIKTRVDVTNTRVGELKEKLKPVSIIGAVIVYVLLWAGYIWLYYLVSTELVGQFMKVIQ